MPRCACWLLGVVLLLPSCSAVEPEKNLTPPFQLTADDEKNVDRLLARWEQWNAATKTFECRFKRWTYDGVFGRPDAPKFVDLGIIQYAAPDRGLYRVDVTEEGGKQKAIGDDRAEQWIFTGRSIVEYNYKSRRVIEHRLPLDSKKSPTIHGPLTISFPHPIVLFGMEMQWSVLVPFADKAETLKKHYYVREVTPAKAKDEIWLEAYPRTSQGGKFQLICRAKDMTPVALKLCEPNGSSSVVYQFYDVKMNDPKSPGDDPFQPPIPKGWMKIVDEPASTKRAN